MTREGEAVLWSRHITRELDRPVEVGFGRARRNVIVVRSNGARLSVRLNESFADAPDEVRDALVSWLRSGKRARRACATLDAYIDRLAHELGPPKRRAVPIRARGDAYDLEEIAREVLASEFAREVNGKLDPTLAKRATWGRRGTRRAQRSIQLGSYDPTLDLIRVHPVLDQPAVPRFFVRYVVFHELLHAADPDRRPGPPPPGARGAKRKRTVHHGPEFKRRERAYSGFERAMRWQEENLDALFRSARSGRPMRRPPAAARAVRKLAKTAQGWLFPDVSL